MTLRQIASLIRNNLMNGLKGVANEAFSIEQLMHEIMLETNAIITTRIAEKTLLPSNVSQRIDGIELKCDDTSGNCTIDSQVSAAHVKIPKIAQFLTVEEALLFVGPLDNSTNFKVYSNTDFIYHKHNFVTANRPFVWLSTSSDPDGYYDLYFFNLGKYNNLKYVSVVARFENPVKLLDTIYADNFSSTEFYAPEMVLNEVIQNITNKWFTYYRERATASLPNTQE
jgi:hypothetical protein